jgi:hypothetical protein
MWCVKMMLRKCIRNLDVVYEDDVKIYRDMQTHF